MNAIRPDLLAAGLAGAAFGLGADSEMAWSPSLLTALNERAAVRNNEISGA